MHHPLAASRYTSIHHFGPRGYGWILGQLRRKPVRKILDLGCGEGTLLRFLTEPASVIYNDAEPLNPDWTSRQLHPSLLSGLDVHLPSLQEAISHTAPRTYEPGRPRYVTGVPRWDELKVQIWHGALETINEEFVDEHECFVATEVVEHLPSEILDQFFPVILGYYRPPLLLLTTPNYDFNALFTAPGHTRSGYPDPTGDTHRIFRHDDHKREWTVSEWRTWCETGAYTYGYEIEVGALGVPIEDDPFGRTAFEVGKASLTAVFRRLDDRPRVRPVVQSQSGGSGSSGVKHVLVAEHIHHAHSGAGQPMEAEEIRNRVKAVLSTHTTNELDVESIWISRDVDVACGGSVPALISALLQSDPDGSEPEWEITEGGRDMLNWLVLWKNWVMPKEEDSRGMWDQGGSEDEELDWRTHGEGVEEEDASHSWPEPATVTDDWWPSPTAAWESDTPQQLPIITQL
ncbi:hypothetical protein BS47DRAFT_1332094 [Hydnum rufescens UP504]|uniref:Small RNA 2'-O-methyltransferase n=1 Tax=Hydnum rufescens UP504 TaxID=1448309 RepID=A0A9P6APX0_9AGAM|nr:hypothetical protein BS47DRAFT_1332094 [Hydnum rufescens UP504]